MKKIYIVEDELLIALVYEHYFAKKNIATKGPFNCNQQLMDNFTEDDCETILLDIQLEDNISGIQVAENIRKISDVPIIFTTGNETKTTKEQSKHLKNIHILTKPVDCSKIIKLLTQNNT